jgi:hypothetical protein
VVSREGAMGAGVASGAANSPAKEYTRMVMVKPKHSEMFVTAAGCCPFRFIMTHCREGGRSSGTVYSPWPRGRTQALRRLTEMVMYRNMVVATSSPSTARQKRGDLNWSAWRGCGQSLDLLEVWAGGWPAPASHSPDALCRRLEAETKLEVEVAGAGRGLCPLRGRRLPGRRLSGGGGPQLDPKAVVRGEGSHPHV